MLQRAWPHHISAIPLQESDAAALQELAVATEKKPRAPKEPKKPKEPKPDQAEGKLGFTNQPPSQIVHQLHSPWKGLVLCLNTLSSCKRGHLASSFLQSFPLFPESDLDLDLTFFCTYLLLAVQVARRRRPSLG
jgi:hypothetical protein